MFVYLTNILLSIVCAVDKKTFRIGKKSYSKQEKCCILFAIQWILISGLRGLSVGADTAEYAKTFYRVMRTPWSVLWSNILLKLKSVDALLSHDLLNKDPGFKLITKIMSVIAPTYQLYLILVAMIFFVLLGRFLTKYTKDPFLGIILFDCLFYSFYAITGIRQTLATAFIVLLGFDYIKDKKLFKFIIVTVIAFFIHKSALCFFPFYFISRIQIKRRTIGIYSVLIVFAFVFRYPMMNVLSVFMGYEQYNQQYDTAGPVLFTFLVFIVYVASIVFRRRLMQNDADFHIKFSALAMALFFIPLAYIDPSAMRVAYYYTIFLMVLVPDIVAIFNAKEKQMLTIGATAVMILLLVRNHPTYTFFWMER